MPVTIGRPVLFPAPMNTMVEKQPREEAIEKRAKGKKMVVEDVPPPTTTPGSL